MAPILSVDPGQNAGAAVVLEEGRRLAAVFAWRKRGSTLPALVLLWSTARDPRGRVGGIFSGHRLGLIIDNVLRGGVASRWRLVVEDTYVGKNPRVAVTSARWSGQFTGPLEDGALGSPVLWVKADEWRAEAFGIARATKREIAKALTLERLPKEIRQQAEEIADKVGGLEHIVDALGIALWADGLRVEQVAKAARKAARKPREKR